MELHRPRQGWHCAMEGQSQHIYGRSPCYCALEPFPPPSGAPLLLAVLWRSSQAWQVSMELVKAPKCYSLLKRANTPSTAIVRQSATESQGTLTLSSLPLPPFLAIKAIFVFQNGNSRFHDIESLVSQLTHGKGGFEISSFAETCVRWEWEKRFCTQLAAGEEWQ